MESKRIYKVTVRGSGDALVTVTWFDNYFDREAMAHLIKKAREKLFAECFKDINIKHSWPNMQTLLWRATEESGNLPDGDYYFVSFKFRFVEDERIEAYGEYEASRKAVDSVVKKVCGGAASEEVLIRMKTEVMQCFVISEEAEK